MKKGQKKKKALVTWSGCGVCTEGKKNGMCKKNECIDINSKQGKAIDKKVRIKTVPQCVVISPNGKVTKCKTEPIVKKFIK